jgi:hypothetical protein
VAGVARFDLEIPLVIQFQIIIHRRRRANAGWGCGKIAIVLVRNVQQIVGLRRAHLTPRRTLRGPAFRASAFGTASFWAAFGAASLWATASAAAPSASTATTAAVAIVGRFASGGGLNWTRRCKLVVEVIQLAEYVVEFRRRGEQIVFVIQVTRWRRIARAGCDLGLSFLTPATTATTSAPATAAATFALAATFVTGAALACAWCTIRFAIRLTFSVSGTSSRLFVKQQIRLAVNVVVQDRAVIILVVVLERGRRSIGATLLPAAGEPEDIDVPFILSKNVVERRARNRRRSQSRWFHGCGSWACWRSLRSGPLSRWGRRRSGRRWGRRRSYRVRRNLQAKLACDR